ncbi:polysaccharide biosynthesis tyrosine autokinase [Hahella aquimaris]|uniref:GumC family protein n=1 Tax=Hahella sp. HNIBRBA332 TaxID=3015983 RepID=UPI00273CE45E|nr:polysaccharide biosynthesis tyrosine autokinase [Hahella sp. HNIBRBA332]WLQ15146.1 polysaccharide biosynthesis tyrosine autokinase [Hahella sp. HNIBRBA332]
MDNLRSTPPRHLADTPGDKEIIDLRRYWNAILEYKWGIVFLVLLAGGAGYVALKYIKPMYQATTTVLIENNQPKVINIQDVYGLNSNNQEYLQTQYEILRSRSLAEEVVKRLELVNMPEFDPFRQKAFNWKEWVPLAQIESVWPFDPEMLDFMRINKKPLSEKAKFEAVVGIFMSRLTIDPVRNTQLVKVRFDARDPKIAALISNATATQFIESHLAAKMALTEKATMWLGESLEGLRDKLRESEKRLQEFREAEKLVDVRGVKTLNAEELSKLTERNVEARRVRMEAANVYQQMTIFGETPPPEYLLELPAILENPLVRSLKERQDDAQRKVDELSKRYGEKHPKMISAMAELKSVKSELETQLQRAARGIESAYKISVENERSIARQLDQAKNSLQGVNRKEFQLRELEREVETNRKLYDLFMSRAKETHEATGLQAAHARIIDSAIPPGSPYKPNKKMIFLMLVMAGFGLGVVRAFIRDALDNTIRSTADIEEKFRLPVLGLLPLVKSKKSKAAFEGFLSSMHSHFAESIRSLRTSLILSRVDQPYKVILVTSTVPGEGKTTVALNLAEALGQTEKVLLIDGDMRRSMLAKSIGLSPDTPGLSDLVAGTAEVEHCLHRLNGTKASVLTAGTQPTNPLEMISSNRFHLVLAVLKKRYDRIIIDSGPTQAVSDSLVLSSYSDAVVYIIRSEDTPAPLIQKGIKRLREVNANLVGAVLNQIDVAKRKNQHEYIHYSSYNTYPLKETSVTAAKTKRRVEPTGV